MVANDRESLRVVAEALQADVKSVCVNPRWVPTVAKALEGSDVLTCTVIGFPLGANASEVKAFEARQAIEAGAHEVDMVIDVAAARAGDRARLVEDVRAERGLTVIAAMHDLTLAGQHGERVALLHDGALSCIGAPAEILTAERIRDIYGASVEILQRPDGPVVAPVRERRR